MWTEARVPGGMPFGRTSPGPFGARTSKRASGNALSRPATPGSVSTPPGQSHQRSTIADTITVRGMPCVR